jgi:hypothetical protein
MISLCCIDKIPNLDICHKLIIMLRGNAPVFSGTRRRVWFIHYEWGILQLLSGHSLSFSFILKLKFAFTVDAIAVISLAVCVVVGVAIAVIYFQQAKKNSSSKSYSASVAGMVMSGTEWYSSVALSASSMLASITSRSFL